MGNTLSILLSKSIANNTVDNHKVAAIIATWILTGLIVAHFQVADEF